MYVSKWNNATLYNNTFLYTEVILCRVSTSVTEQQYTFYGAHGDIVDLILYFMTYHVNILKFIILHQFLLNQENHTEIKNLRAQHGQQHRKQRYNKKNERKFTI